MLESIDSINEYMKNASTYDEFVANKMLCHAVIYNLQCIGESVYYLTDDYVANHPGIDWFAIAGLRHILVHDYYQVSMERIWAILQNDLAPLSDYLKKIQ